MTDPNTDILKLVYNACDPQKPATDAQYVDCSDVRGQESFAAGFHEKLRYAEDVLCVLFTGHSGCGKSSELATLANQLRRPHPPDGYKRYYPVVVDADEYLDRFDAGMPDLLLAIVAQLGKELTTLGIDTSGNVFRRLFGDVTKFFGELSVEEAKVGWGMGNVEIGVKRLRTDPTGREQVRKALVPRTASLLGEIAALFADVGSRLQAVPVAVGTAHFDDFVLIVDNLENIDRFDGQPPGAESHRTLFVQGSPQLRGLGAHVVFTVPLNLVRSPSGPLLLSTYDEVSVLPMIKVMERDGARFEPGWRKMHEMVESRLASIAVGEAVEAQALDLMIEYSGGHARSLMRFLQSAAVYAKEPPIRVPHAERAIGQTVRTYSTSIPDRHWPKLVAVERSADRKIDPEDEDYITMLENLSVLEYVNGPGAAGVFLSSEPWYAVNPVVKELVKYKRAQAEAAAGGS